MPLYAMPVNLVIEATSDLEAELRVEEFLLRAISEYRTLYNVKDYYFDQEIPDLRR